MRFSWAPLTRVPASLGLLEQNAAVPTLESDGWPWIILDYSKTQTGPPFEVASPINLPWDLDHTASMPLDSEGLFSALIP